MRSSAARTSGSAYRFLHVCNGDRFVVPAGGHRRPHFALDPTASGVVLAEPALCGAHDAGGLGGTQAHVAGAERHHQVVAQRALAVGDGLVDDQADT